MSNILLPVYVQSVDPAWRRRCTSIKVIVRPPGHHPGLTVSPPIVQSALPCLSLYVSSPSSLLLHHRTMFLPPWGWALSIGMESSYRSQVIVILKLPILLLLIYSYYSPTFSNPTSVPTQGTLRTSPGGRRKSRSISLRS